jgi:Zn-dependent protease with chaperone function
MQNTRISNLLGFVAVNVQRLFANPWRRLAVWLIALLLGNFLGSVVTLLVGQVAQSDIGASVLLLVLTELLSWIVYRRRGGVWVRGSVSSPQAEIDRDISSLGNLVLDLLNALKIGFIYSMFVEAFKLGS